jgi:hypothetical protein
MSKCVNAKTALSQAIAAAIIALAGLAFAGPYIDDARAQPGCDSENIAKHLPKECKGEEIIATGNQRPTRIWALKTAHDNWQDAVLAKYGERYSRWKKAACLREECFRSSLAGFRRCIVKGYPCSEKVSLPDVSPLSKSQLKEMQRLLNRLGARPKLRVDGIFGVKSVIALEKWQKKSGHKVDGEPNEKNLEILRKAAS